MIITTTQILIESVKVPSFQLSRPSDDKSLYSRCETVYYRLQAAEGHACNVFITDIKMISSPMVAKKISEQNESLRVVIFII